MTPIEPEKHSLDERSLEIQKKRTELLLQSRFVDVSQVKWTHESRV